MARVIVGMSGGVDSSVAALCLQEQGYDVVGATMLVWSPPGVDMGYSDSCCGLSAAEDARRVCSRLGIPHYTLDFREEFYDRIVQDYVKEYRAGRTPNPCIRCNEWIKFRALYDRAVALGAEYVATGHYARISRDEMGTFHLLRGTDRQKDQAYALYRLGQEQLAHTLFPLGGMRKVDVRAWAARAELPTAGKPDSQETCFVPNNDYPQLLKLLDPDLLRPGRIVDPEGRPLGKHEGFAAFTIGQRKRINVGSPVPLYVSRIAADTGDVQVAPGGHPSLSTREVWAGESHWIGPELPVREGGGMEVTARIRYNSPDLPGVLSVWNPAEGGWLRVRFEEPVRAVAPGQSLVCFRGDEVLGGGIILDTAPEMDRGKRGDHEQ